MKCERKRKSWQTGHILMWWERWFTFNTDRKFKMRHVPRTNESGKIRHRKLLCVVSMNVWAKNGRQFGWILDQSLMDTNAMIITMMMMQYKHKVAIELTLSRNYNKYDIIIIKAHLWLSLSLRFVCACHLRLSQFYFVGICNRHSNSNNNNGITLCFEDFSPVSRLITVITVITGCVHQFALSAPLLWSSLAKLIKNLLV